MKFYQKVVAYICKEYKNSGMINITEKFEPCSNSIYREIDKLWIFFKSQFFAKKWVKISFLDHNDIEKMFIKLKTIYSGNFSQK